MNATAAPVAFPSTGSARRRSDIQGLRGIAVLLVMAYHAGLPLYGGFIGVDVFFVISGFVITGLLTRDHEDDGRLSLSAFYARRVRRLLPALALVVTVTCLVAVLVLPLEAQELTGRTGAAAAVFLANVEIMRTTGGYFSPLADDNALLHTWTLSVEEQFYVVFPAVLLLGWAVLRSRRRQGPIIATSVVVVLSLALSVYASRGLALPFVEDSREFAFYSPFTRAWQFGVGALLALAWPSTKQLRQSVPPRLVSALLMVGLGLVAGAALLARGRGYPGVSALVPTGGAALLIAFGYRQDLWLGRLLSVRPLVAAGELSYSLYLWHWPVLILGSSLLARESLAVSSGLVLASVVPAYLSYRWLENPVRSATRITGWRAAALAGICIVVPFGAAWGLQAGSANSWGDPEVARFEAQRTETPLGRSRGCHVSDPRRPVAPLEDCTFGTGSLGPIMVVGDSHADALGDSLVAAVSRGRPVVLRTANGCPFLADNSSWHIYRESERARACLDGLAQQWAEIEALKPAALVIANRGPWYVGQASSRADAAQDWGDAVGETLDRLSALGIPVMLVHTVPEHPTRLTECVHTRGVDPACARTSRGLIDEAQAATLAAERAAAAEFGARAWDPARVLCDSTFCVRVQDGVPLYRDHNHLAPSAAVMLADPLRSALDELVSSSSPQPGQTGRS